MNDCIRLFEHGELLSKRQVLQREISAASDGALGR
jgi:hypothetical protein